MIMSSGKLSRVTGNIPHSAKAHQTGSRRRNDPTSDVRRGHGLSRSKRPRRLEQRKSTHKGGVRNRRFAGSPAIMKSSPISDQKSPPMRSRVCPPRTRPYSYCGITHAIIRRIIVETLREDSVHKRPDKITIAKQRLRVHARIYQAG